MVKNDYSNHMHKNFGKIVALCIVMALLSVAIQTPYVHADYHPRFVFSPEFGRYLVGENFTLTVNLTNALNLFTWEVVLKYNTTILNLTSEWIPTDNVFAGHGTVSSEPTTDVDNKDGLYFTDFGSSLIGQDGIATVENAILFNANFTVVEAGEGSITTATIGSSVHKNASSTPIYSFILAGDTPYTVDTFQDFTVETCTILIGALNAVPRAEFTIGLPSADLNMTNHLIVDDNPPSGIDTYVKGYEGYMVFFNASLSNDPDGYITQYIWNFDDGQNATVNVNYNATGNSTIDIPAGREAALEAANMTHVYDKIGPYGVTLIVVDNGVPSANLTSQASLPTSPHYVIIGLALVYFDWTPLIYIVMALIALAIVLYAVRRIVRLTRQRRGRIAAKKTEGPTGRPPSTTGSQGS